VTLPLKTAEARVEAARWAYRLFLDREPENESAALGIQKADTEALRQAFVSSSEYGGRVKNNLSRTLKMVDVAAPANSVDVEISQNIAAKLRSHVQETWTRLGEQVPHWSVLSSEEYLPEHIGETERTFYESGEQDLAQLVGVLQRHGRKPKELPDCFEFGCGLGRVTLPLSSAFRRVTACDISASHLAVARERIDAAGRANISFVLADSEDFGIRDSFDLWFSRIVLQHNPPPIIHAILDRAFTKLNRGGLAVFQVPTHATGYNFDARRYVDGLDGQGNIEMHCLPQRYIFELARRHGLELLEVREDSSAGPLEHWVSNVFVIGRPK